MSKKGKGPRKDKVRPHETQGDLSTINIEEVTYMFLLRADLSARNRRRISGTLLSNLGDAQIDDNYQQLIDKLEELHRMIGYDAPLFPQPCIVTEPGAAHQLFQQCYELAKKQALEELKERE